MSTVFIAERVTAQVAVEAIINDRGAYDDATVSQVLAVAESAGVSDLYLDMIRGGEV